MSRRGHGSVKVPNVKLRPAPAPSTSNNNNAPGSSLGLRGDSHADEDGFGLKAELRGESKPLEGIVVCVTGIKEERASLQAMAIDLGARVQQPLTADVTHLIAPNTSTQKYKTAIEYGIAVLKPSWLHALRDIWLAGDSPHLSSISSSHALRPFHGLYICVTGFSTEPALRTQLTQAIASNGGTYKPTFVQSCSHLVVGPEYTSHQTALRSPKVAKALELQKEGHEVHVVWSEWLDDSLTLGGALKEDNYSIHKPRAEQSRTSAVKSLRSDQPAPKTVRSPILKKDSSTLADDSTFSTKRGSSSSSSSFFAQDAGRRKKPRLQSSDVSGLLGCADENDLDLSGSKSERSLSQLGAPQPPTAGGSQLSRFGGKSGFRASVPPRSSRPFPPSAGAAPSQSHSRSQQPPPDSKEQFFAGLRFVLWGLEQRHEDLAGRVVAEHGGQVVEAEEGQDEQVDWVVTKLLQHDLSHLSKWPQRKLVAQTWLEKCLSVEGVIDPDHFWAGRPFRLPSDSGHLESLRISLPPAHLKECDRFILERTCRQLDIKWQEAFSEDWATHVIISDSSNIAADAFASISASVLHASDFLKLLRVPFSLDQKEPAAPPGVLTDCYISISKATSSSAERSKVLRQIEALGGQVSSGFEHDTTHLIHSGDTRAADVRQALSKGIQVVHPTWLDKCQSTSSRAVERAFPSTLQPGSALTFASMPSASPPARTRVPLSRRGSKRLTMTQLDSGKDDTIMSAGPSTDDDELPPPLDTRLPAAPTLSPKPKQPAAQRVSSFVPILPDDICGAAKQPEPQPQPSTSSPVQPQQAPAADANLLSGLKSLFNANADESDDGRAAVRGRKARRTGLQRNNSSPSATGAADGSDDFARTSPSSRSLAGQKRPHSAYEMSQLQGTQAEETVAATESSMHISVVDPKAREAKLRLLGHRLPTPEPPDPSSEDYIEIPEPVPKSRRARRYRQERV